MDTRPMTDTEIVSPVKHVEPDRDRWGRPLIVPPGGGKPVAYTRATTVAKALDDTTALEKWSQRMVVLGLNARTDLRLLASTLGAGEDDKRGLNQLCEQAIEAAKASAAANIGTAIHRYVEIINNGGDPEVPSDIAGEVAAYKAALAPYEIVAAEVFAVLDDHRVAGTADVILREKSSGELILGDLKTGSDVFTYGQGSISIQLGIYSRGVRYDVPSGERRGPLGVDQDRGLVIHLPARRPQGVEAVCTLYDVDLAAGWEAAQLAMAARAYRSRRDLFTVRRNAPGVPLVMPERAAPEPLSVDDRIRVVEHTTDASVLVELWRAAEADGVTGSDMERLIAACAARKAELTNPARRAG